MLSPDKLEAKPSQLTRIREFLTYPTTPNIMQKIDCETPQPIGTAQLMGESENNLKSAQKNNDYERTQPIKIKQLLEEYESSSKNKMKSAQKNNERPTLLPERLGQFSEVKSAKKSEKRSERPTLLPQRLGPFSEVKSAKMSEKRSERPTLLPQRLGPFSEVKSAKMSEERSERPRLQPERLGPSSEVKSAKKSEKRSGSNASVHSTKSNKCARRFLNFNKISARTPKGTENKLATEESVLKKQIYKPKTKQSLLLPPNSIKQKHLQKCTNEVNRYSKISEVSNEMDDTNTIHDSAIEKESKIINESPKINNNPTVISNNKETHDKQEIDAPSNHIAPKISSTNHKTRQSSIPRVEPRFLTVSQSKSLPEILTNKEHRLLSEDIPKPIQNNAKSVPCVKSKGTDDCVPNLCSNSQDTRMATAEKDPSTIQTTKYDENDHKLHGSSEMIYINRDQIIRLESDLKNLLRETEENVIKLRSTLTCVAKLLSINDNNGGITLSNNAELSKETKMADKEVQVDACSLSSMSQYSEEQLKTPITRVSQITVTDKYFLSKTKLSQMDEESNKENVEDLNVKRISDVTSDGSFLELENKLNIVHANHVRIFQTQPRTPRVAKCKQKRSLREYMALKSSISFLETPDSRRVRPLCQLNNNDKPALNARYISSKLLTDLDELYSESPDT